MSNNRAKKGYPETRSCGDCALYAPTGCHCDAGECGITGSLVEERQEACKDCVEKSDQYKLPEGHDYAEI